MDTQELFKQIVKELGNGWQYEAPKNDPNYPGCTVKHPKGWSFTLHLDSYRKKIEVWGDYPSYKSDPNWTMGGEQVLHGNEYPKRIYCASTRPAADIAKDIVRRFLPDYEVAFDLALDRITARTLMAEQTANNVAALAEVLGERARPGTRAINWSTDVHGSGFHWADFEVNNTTVTIKAYSLPLEKALAIAKILREK